MSHSADLKNSVIEFSIGGRERNDSRDPQPMNKHETRLTHQLTSSLPPSFLPRHAGHVLGGHAKR